MSDRLEMHRLNSSSAVALYTVAPDQGIETLIASTPQVIQLLNNPEICSVAFQSKLSEALYQIIQQLLVLPNSELSRVMRSSPIDVFYILRGGLNFDLHRSLAEITRTSPEVTFISSQRFTSKNGFEIGEADYQKWSIQDKALLCIGDISATATTLQNVLDYAINHYQEKKPGWLLIFTIGTAKLREMLVGYQEKLKRVWAPHFRGITVVFLEEIFYLYTGEPVLAGTHLAATDFFRRDFPAALEFEYASIAQPICFLERCAIYDGGSRAFEPATYLHNLYRYWVALKELGKQYSVAQLLTRKGNFLDYQLGFDEWLQRRSWWAGMNQTELVPLYEKGQVAVRTLTSRSLIEVSEDRLNTLKKAMEIRYAEDH